VDEGRAIIAASGLPIQTADTLAEAAELAVAAARGRLAAPVV
jgi:succinyl-CoA synthetase beta subunit